MRWSGTASQPWPFAFFRANGRKEGSGSLHGEIWELQRAAAIKIRPRSARRGDRLWGFSRIPKNTDGDPQPNTLAKLSLPLLLRRPTSAVLMLGSRAPAVSGPVQNFRNQGSGGSGVDAHSYFVACSPCPALAPS